MSEEREALSRAYRGYAERNEATGRWSTENPGNRFILEERDRVLSSMLRASGLRWVSPCVLDIGCGSASLLPADLEPGRRVGVDLLYERLPAARIAGIPDVACADGSALPFPAESFDIVVLSTVLSSVGDAGTRRRIGSEAARVLRSGGAVIWYDMRVPNPFNRNITPISRKELRRVFPELRHTTESVTLVPQVARRLGDRAHIYASLSTLRVTRSHLAGVLTKP